MKLLTYFVLFLLAFSLVAAVGEPTPVAGKVTLPGYGSLAGLDIEQRNARTGVTYEISLDDNGYYLIDWANLPFFDGDVIEVTVPICAEQPVCHTSFTLHKGVPQRVDVVVPANFEVVIEQQVKYICSDGIEVLNKEDCPLAEQKVTIEQPILQDKINEAVKEALNAQVKTQYVCWDKTLVDFPEDCEPKNNSWIYGVVAALVAIFLGAGGWKIYNGKMKHFHKGIIGYHDPNTSHSNPKYKHTPWKTSAFKCIKDVKDIQKGIDLSAR